MNASDAWAHKGAPPGAFFDSDVSGLDGAGTDADVGGDAGDGDVGGGDLGDGGFGDFGGGDFGGVDSGG